MKKTLVFDDEVVGHHLEYLHHLYETAGEKVNEEFIFAVPRSFDFISNNYEWKSYPHIKFHYIIDDEIAKLNGNIIRRSYYLSKLLKRIAREFNVTNIFLIVLIGFIPFLPFILGNKYKVSGIIYQIYLYRWKKSSIITKSQDVLKYLILTKLNMFEKLFILNDRVSPYYLNKIFKVQKFHFLPDPVVPILNLELEDMHEQLNIRKNSKVVLHFGSLNRNKGTLEVLQAISLMNSQKYSNYTFIFAGIIQDDIKESFYNLYNNIRKSANIIVFDYYCSINLIGSLCITSDIILCPYKRTNQSSGVIGYAVQFKKPVIVPKQGLLGKLVKTNKIGYLIEDTSPNEILKGIEKSIDPNLSSNYMTINSISNFTKTIFTD